MTDEGIRYIGQYYLDVMTVKVAAEHRMKKYIENRQVDEGAARFVHLDDDDDEKEVEEDELTAAAAAAGDEAKSPEQQEHEIIMRQMDRERVLNRAAARERGGAGRGAGGRGTFRKVQLEILDERRAKEIEQRIKESRYYQIQKKVKDEQEKQKSYFLYEAAQLFSDSTMWHYCERVRGLGEVAAMTILTIVNTEKIVDREHNNVVTAGKINAYLGLVPGQGLHSGTQGNFNPQMKGRAWMIRRNVIMAQDNYYAPIYRIYKEFYKLRPDRIAQNGTTAVGTCGHYIASPTRLNRAPEYIREKSSKDVILEDQKNKIKVTREEIDNYRNTHGEEQTNSMLDKDIRKILMAVKLENIKSVVEQMTERDISEQIHGLYLERGYIVMCPVCKLEVNVDRVEDVRKRPGWNAWNHETAARGMGKIVLSHLVEIITRAEGKNFNRHRNYIPPKPDTEAEINEVLIRFQKEKREQLERYYRAFGESGSIQAVADNLDSYWKSKNIQQQQQQGERRHNTDNNIGSSNSRSTNSRRR